ncbi:carboxymuconolactone decarboxylase family protein [Streptomyces sp. NPDC047515]|uniref:carboxymuconolactone decarboxylase family protein n=1 Tax=Streptomyces sp. NPDC047515 TaxID=3155380 RepID=UPI0033FBCD22
MNARLNLFGNPVTGKALKHIVAAGKVIADSTLPDSTRELVLLRASQINGCAYCVDMHTKDAAHAGETSVRLHLVAAWREATLFTDAERAALELAEEGTRIADAAGGAGDEVWANAATPLTIAGEVVRAGSARPGPVPTGLGRAPVGARTGESVATARFGSSSAS